MTASTLTPPELAELDWAAMKNRPLTLAEKQRVREFYRGDYHVERDYAGHSPWHVAIASYRVELTRAVFPDLGKVLDGGCAAGEEVAAFRAAGVDAWGFDICPDLHDVAYPEARDFVRIGRPDRIPYGPLDGYRTFVSFDVLEHVPIDELQRLPAELVRLGVRQVGCIIANDELNDGHITIQDTDWYVRLFASAGFRLMTELTDALHDVHAPVGWDPAAERVIWAPYHLCGQPRNGWNRVPGHLFFVRGA